jgi:hypothetical protein
MARPRKDPNEGKPPPRGRRKGKPPGGEGGDGGGDEQGQPPGNPDADPVRIHREYVERHVGGGGEPTPEAYTRAVEQWHRLPGAVTAPATELTGEEVTRKPEDDEDAETEGGETGEEDQQ